MGLYLGKTNYILVSDTSEERLSYGQQTDGVLGGRRFFSCLVLLVVTEKTC